MIEKNLSPNKNQPYIWFAKYKNGTTDYEYDEDMKETMFDYIDKANTAIFGLIGNGLKIYFDTNTGIFNIGSEKFHISIKKDGKEFVDLFNIKKDLIEYKTAHSDCRIGRKIVTEPPVIEGFYIGYKTKLDNLFVQIVFSVPVYGEDLRPYFMVRMSGKDNNYTVDLINDSNTVFDSKNIEIKESKASSVNLQFIK